MKSGIWSRRASILALVALLGLLAIGVAASGAQSAPSSPNGMPEVVGLYPGMYVGDAYNQLKSYPANVTRTVGMGQQRIHGLNGDNPLVEKVYIPSDGVAGRDQIAAFVTVPPNKQVVWFVHRSVSFEYGKSPSVAAVVAGLRQKYGPEIPIPTSHLTAQGGELQWIFDHQGRRVPDSMAVCREGLGDPTEDGIRDVVIDPKPDDLNFVRAEMPACKTFVYLYIYVRSGTGDGVASTMDATMIDLGLALNEGLRTQAALQGVAKADQKAAAQRQKKIDKSNALTY